MGYLVKCMRVRNVTILPEHLGERLEEEVANRVRSLIVDTPTEHGLVMDILKLKIEDGAEIRFDNTGSAYFSVLLRVRLYLPILGEILETRINDVPSNGYYVDEPVPIFINSDSKRRKVGDDVRIKITSVKFKKGKFIVLAEEAKK